MKKILSVIMVLAVMVSSFGATFSVTLVGQTAFDLNTATWTVSGADADGIPDSDDQVQVRMFNCPNINVQNSAAFVCDDLAFLFLTAPTFAQFNVNASLTAIGDINLGNTANFFVFPNQPITIGGSFTNTTNVVTFFDFATIHYNGSSNQEILPVNYGTLQLSGTGNKMLTASGATTMNVSSFLPGTSTVEFNSGVAGQVLPVLGDYYNVLLSEQNKELGANFVVTNNLEINSSIQLETKSFNLSVGGDLVLNGDLINTSTESLTFNGSTTTTVSGSQTLNTKSLIIDKSSSSTQVVFNTGVEIESDGVLTVTRGALNANGNLTMLSSSEALSARLAEVTSGNASVTGNMTVERFVPSASASGKFWWHIGTPLSGVSVNQLQDDITITGSFTGASTITGSQNGQSMRTYDETNSSTDMSEGWQDFPASANSEIMSVGKGYRVYIRDNTSSTVSNYKIDVTGGVTIGNVDFGVTYTSSGTATSDGWNFLSNPYPSPIDWGAADWTKTNIEATAYVWDAKQKMYRNLTSLDGDIPSFQGFWVQTNASSPSLILRESCKKSSTEVFSRPVTPSNVLEISIEDKNPNDVYNTSITYLTLDNNAVLEKDMLDVNQLGRNLNIETWENTTLLDIATKSSDDYILRNNFIPVSSNVVEVPLSITFNEGAEFGFEFHKQNFIETAYIILKDKYLGTEQLLDDNTFVTFSVDDDLKSKASDRFSLLVSSRPLSVSNKIDVNSLKVFPNPVSDDYVDISGLVSSEEALIVLSDINGVLLSEVPVSPNNGYINERVDVSSLEKGIYLLTIKTVADIYTQKIIIE